MGRKESREVWLHDNKPLRSRFASLCAMGVLLGGNLGAGPSFKHVYFIFNYVRMCMSVWEWAHIKHCQTLGGDMSRNRNAGVSVVPMRLL